MREVFIASDNILSPIGSTAARNFTELYNKVSGVKGHEDKLLSAVPFYASLFKGTEGFLNDDKKHTKFEQLLIASIDDALKGCEINASDKKTVLILSSTKGNISLLETEEPSVQLNERIALHTSASILKEHFHLANQPIIISNACISGIMAILMGTRLIQSGQYENVIVAGADVISKFVLSGFQSFQAVSSNPCRPFDAARDGINLGEGAATIILSSNNAYSKGIQVSGGSISNDANHISGPSRTGEELNFAIGKSLQAAGLSATDIDFISAHGTATLYNDEMEAKAITLSNLQNVPVNSLKGYYGHTLGAAGIIESIISIRSLKENVILPTLGYENIGVTQPINICSSLLKKPLQHCLKTASGFGGCNAAIIFSKHNN